MCADGHDGQTKVRLTLPRFLRGGYGWSVSFQLSHHFQQKKKVETECVGEFLSVCHAGMKLAKGINVM